MGLLSLAIVALFGASSAWAGPDDELPAPGAPSGDGIQPVVEEGNVTCGDLGYDHEVKIEPVSAGATNDDGTLFATIDDIYDEGVGPLFDWSTNMDIQSVVVKGGNDANSYVYGVPGDDEDTRLHAPINPENGTYFGLSHVSFCYDDGVIPPAADLDATKTATGSFDRTYEWDVAKEITSDNPAQAVYPGTVDVDYKVTVTNTGFSDGDYQVTGKITVTNPNDAAVEDVDISDDIDEIDDPNASCSLDSGGTDETIPAGESNFGYTCTYSSAPSGTDTNTATVEWGDQTLSDGSELDAGSVEPTAAVDWDDVTVPTNESDECVDVTDAFDVIAAESLDPATLCLDDLVDSKYEYTYNRTIDVELGCFEYDNTAAITGQDSAEVLDTADATATVCGHVTPTVEKDATGSFKRTYLWQIAKNADKTSVTKPIPGTVTVNYTITVEHDDGTDSDWKVTGVITVSNGNPADVTGVDVSDQIDGDADCSVTGGGNDGEDETIPADGTAEFDYTCTYNSAPYGTDTNTVKIDWPENDLDGAILPAGDASDTAEVDWTTVDPSELVDDCVDVTDSVDGADPPKFLGTVCVGDDNPTELSDSATFNVVLGCHDHTNVAEFETDDTGATGSDDATVTVCGFQPGKTMGFWGNNNGQALLTANNAFSAANAVTLGGEPGCSVLVDTAAKSKKILPTTLNGVSIITDCDASNERDNGINVGSLNTLLAQTLAISYNIKYIANYAGQTISGMGCTPVTGLTGASTVEAVRDRANYLIQHAQKNNGTDTITQTLIGQMNTLLGCLNREA